MEFRAAITQAGTGQILWQGSLGQAAPGAAKGASFSKTLSGLKPELWNPDSPVLYNLQVTATKDGKPVASRTVRIGFRSFEIRDGQFHLNGRPVFLRGIAINPPGRTIPPEVGESRAFAEAYVRYLKSQNVNIFRLTTDESQVWFDVCDELGMMMYAGRYGSPPEADGGKRVAPKDFDRCIAGYRKLFEGYVSHPSIVMYLLANELPVSGERGADVQRSADPRPRGPEGMGPDPPLYRQRRLRRGPRGRRVRRAPLLGLVLQLVPHLLQPAGQALSPAALWRSGQEPAAHVHRMRRLLHRLEGRVQHRPQSSSSRRSWAGSATRQTRATDALEYQAFMVKQATESFRRMRPLNPRLAGLMPFTIFFHNWSGISSFDQMKPKPAMEQLGVSYQPVLLSWELWTPQVYAGTKLRAIAHVINDAEDGSALTNAALVYQVRAKDGGESCQGKVELPAIPYFGTWSKTVTLDLPAGLATGEYVISGSIVAGGRTVSTNWVGVFVAGGDWKTSAPASEPPVYVV